MKHLDEEGREIRKGDVVQWKDNLYLVHDYEVGGRKQGLRMVNIKYGSAPIALVETLPPSDPETKGVTQDRRHMLIVGRMPSILENAAAAVKMHDALRAIDAVGLSG